MLVRASIPSFHQVESRDNGRQFTVYLIEVYVSGRCHRIERRYRAFHNLHKQLRRIMHTPEFPPKKVRNLGLKLLEQRRVALEKYLQGVLQAKPLPKPLQTFLCLPDQRPKLLRTVDHSPSGSSLSLTDLGDPLATKSEMSHQPVLTFIPNPYIDISGPGVLPDIVVKGVLMGFYSKDEDDINEPCLLR